MARAPVRPRSIGSGIPTSKSVVLGEEQLRWWRVLPVKFFGGLASIGGGLALGREGPTIQIGGRPDSWFPLGFA